MKKHSKSCRQSEPTTKRAKSRGPVQRDAKEVMAEVLEKLTGRGALDARVESGSARQGRRENTVGPNLDGLTVVGAFSLSCEPGPMALIAGILCCLSWILSKTAVGDVNRP
jgi:hypothetical protein